MPLHRYSPVYKIRTSGIARGERPTTSGPYLVPYPFDNCPHCGSTLDPPDEHRDRQCGDCQHTVMAATVKWQILR